MTSYSILLSNAGNIDRVTHALTFLGLEVVPELRNPERRSFFLIANISDEDLYSLAILKYGELGMVTLKKAIKDVLSDNLSDLYPDGLLPAP